MIKLKYILMLCLCLSIPAFGSDVNENKPNIVWILVDDMSCHFAYQEEPLVKTPHVDQIANEGVVFTRAYATAPVCSTFRSAMITGMYQTSIGAHHHRSSRGEVKIHLAKNIRTIPEIFRDAGYYTTNADSSGKRPGKEDYNFVYNKTDLYDGIDWSKRKKGQPFFAQYQLRGGKLRNVERWYKQEVEKRLNQLIKADEVTLPPYYPDHPVIRQDWAAYLNSVSYTDIEVGRIIAILKQEKVLDNTIIFFLTDHGLSHARGKQFLYEEGIKIPFVVWGPKFGLQKSVRNDFIAHIDLGASSLALAGIKVPETMQGKNLFSKNYIPRKYIVSARDRCDETVDHIRSIRIGSYKYIKNYLPKRPYLQPCNYKDNKPFMPILRKLYADGKLNKIQSLHMAEIRPEEELYDLENDRWEVKNLAKEANQQERLREYRKILAQWEKETDDKGRIPEPQDIFDSDMKLYLQKVGKRSPEKAKSISNNINLMKQWAKSGK